MDETQTPEAIIRSVLYGVLDFPEQDIPETVTALNKSLQSAGYSIVRTKDHISRADSIIALVNLMEDEGGAYNRGVRAAIRALFEEQS